MNKYIIPLFIIFISLSLLVYFSNNYDIFENWVPYKQEPYDYIFTGSQPMSYYLHNRYKKPYRYPYNIYSSYPYPYLRYLN